MLLDAIEDNRSQLDRADIVLKQMGAPKVAYLAIQLIDDGFAQTRPIRDRGERLADRDGRYGERHLATFSAREDRFRVGPLFLAKSELEDEVRLHIEGHSRSSVETDAPCIASRNVVFIKEASTSVGRPDSLEAISRSHRATVCWTSSLLRRFAGSNQGR